MKRESLRGKERNQRNIDPLEKRVKISKWIEIEIITITLKESMTGIILKIGTIEETTRIINLVGNIEIILVGKTKEGMIEIEGIGIMAAIEGTLEIEEEMIDQNRYNPKLHNDPDQDPQIPVPPHQASSQNDIL